MNRTKPIVTLLLIYMLFFTAAPLRSQFSYSIHYTVNDGLPSSKIYDMIEDSHGYLWFATENGVSRFNGYGFSNFTTEDGLPTNSTVKLFEDVLGRIWFLSYHGSLSYFAEGKIHALQIKTYLNKINIPFVAQLYADSTQSIWISPFNGGLYKINEDEEIEHIFNGPSKTDWIYLYLKLYSDGYILAYVQPDTEFSKNRAEMAIVGKDEYYFGFERDPSEHHFSFLEVEDFYLLSFGRKVYQVENEKIVRKLEFDKEVIGINSDKENNVWVSEKFNGVFQYQDGVKSPQINHFFSGLTVSKVLQDVEGNYWFSTTESGVFFVPSIEINNYNKTSLDIQNDIILTLGIHENSLYFSTDGKELYYAEIIDNQLTGFKSLDLVNELIDNVYSILPISDNELYATGNFSVDGFDEIVKINRGGQKINLVNYGYDLYQLKNGDVVVSHGNGIKIVRGTEIIYVSPKSVNTRVFGVELHKDSSFWLGTIIGLLKLKNDQFAIAFPDEPVLNSRISVLKYHIDDLWVGSFDNGLVLLSNDSIYHLSTETGLSSNRIKSIYIENDSVCWIGTNRGLNKISISGNLKKKFRVETLDIWDGLSSNEINKIVKHEDRLWLGTDKGLVSFNPARINFRHKPARLYLERILVDGIGDVSLQGPIELIYSENSITFEFIGIAYNDPESTLFLYKLEGLNAGWNETHNTSVRFHDLQPGKYNFVLKSIVKSGDESKSIHYGFEIKPHFTQTLLFEVIVYVCCILFVFTLVYYFVMAQKKRNTLQRQIHLAEQKAMLSQMNPHFIFNSLNSIQNFILDNDGENANIYLVTFSSLIRRILDASQKNFISLKEELETIKLYLELEKFRFNEKFDYHIEVNAKINEDNVSLPSMILQPYLENAIWHGIVPKQDHGLLQLIVKCEGSHGIVISIIDDGIGRKKAYEISKKRKHHKPTGIRNVEERINLLNKLNKSHMKVKIIDLVDEKNSACGTRVDFYLERSED